MSENEPILYPDEQDGVEIEHILEGSGGMFYLQNSKAVEDYFWMLFDPDELL